MSKQTYIGTVQDGKLILTKPVRTQMLADMAKYEGKRVELEVKKLPRRSIKQNAYYWGVVVSMVRKALRDLGHDVNADDTHSFLKDRFNGREIASIDGEVIGKIGGSTSELNKPEFMDYLAAIHGFALEYLGIDIPEPNEQTTLDFNTAA